MLKKHITKEMIEKCNELINKNMKKSEVAFELSKLFNVNVSSYNVDYMIKMSQIDESKNNFDKILEGNGFEGNTWKYGWIKENGASIFIKNKDFEISYEQFIDDLINDIKKHTINYPKIEYKEDGDGYCLIVDIADHHFGKLSIKEETGHEYNLKIAKKRFEDGIDKIIQRTMGFKKDKIIFVIGNDILHTDTNKNTTNKGTLQDVDGKWYEAFKVAKNCYINAIEKLQTIAPVHIIHNMSNHDFTSGFLLSQTINAFFHKNPNLTWDIGPAPRKYYMYGKNLLAFTHGDGIKERLLPMVIAEEAKKYWSKASFRYLYMHHVHHKIAKEYPGITIEYLRSASSPDSWHTASGFINKPAIDYFIIDKNDGQIARFTHYFK